MQISSIKIYQNKMFSPPLGKPAFAGNEKDLNKNRGLASGLNKFKSLAGDKFFKSPNAVSAKDKIFQRFNAECDIICDEQKTAREENGILTTNFDPYTTYKKTEFVLDEDKKLKQVVIKNVDDDTKSVKFDFDEEKLSGATCTINGKKIKLNTKSPDFEKSFLQATDFDLSTGVLIGDIDNIKLKHGHIANHFDSINNVVYGKASKKLSNALKEYEEKFEGKKIYADHNIDPVVIKNCIEIFDDIPLEDIPQSIVLTNFIQDGVAGQYCQTEEIVIRPTKNKENFAKRLFHEMQHRKDYLAGKSLGQRKTGYALIYGGEIMKDCDGQILEGKIEKAEYNIIFKDKKLKKLIEDKVSRYAATNATEFIAEIGTMMRQGTIGVTESMKTDNTLYSIKNNYKNAEFKNCTINEDEFKTLIKTYGLLGGIPEFNNVLYCKDAIALTQEDIFAPE